MYQEKLDETFWNNKYINNEDKWDIGKPTPKFIEWNKSLTSKLNILIPGCGKGHDVFYLSKFKHNIYALDFSTYAINYIKSIADKESLSINIIKDNFFNINTCYHSTFDIILEYTFFCAINPVLRDDYFKISHKLLKPNGKIVGLFLVAL